MKEKKKECSKVQMSGSNHSDTKARTWFCVVLNTEQHMQCQQL